MTKTPKKRSSGTSLRQSQADKFRDAARELETDQSEEAFDKIVKRIAKGPPPKGEKPPKRK